MAQRWASAAVGIPLYIGLCLWGSLPFTVGIIIAAAIGLAEMVRAYQAKGIRPNPALACLGLLGPAVGLLPDAHDLWSGWGAVHDWTASRIGIAILGVLLVVGIAWEVYAAARTGRMN